MNDLGNFKGFHLGRAVKVGIAWTATGRGIQSVLTLIGGVILARLLEPADFGIFGIAKIFTGLAIRFGNIGFGLALVQRKEVRDEHISSLFTVHLLIFLLLAVVLMALSPFVGSFFHNPLVTPVLAVMALAYLVVPFSSVARVVMQRRMDFKGPTIAVAVNRSITVSAAITLAWEGYGVWSLVYADLFGALIGAIIIVAQAGWRPRIRYNHQAMRELFSFGLNIFFKRLLIYGSENIDYLIIGKRLGADALGLYEKAYGMVDNIVKDSIGKIEPVLFSAFSKIQEDRTRLLAAYHKVMLTLSLFACPVFFGLYLVAPAGVYVLFGEKWLPSVVPLQIMCIAGLLRMYLEIMGSVINAMGRIAPEVVMRVLTFLLLAVGCWFGSFWGIVGVAIAVTGTVSILTIAMTFYLSHLTGMTWVDLLRPQSSPFIASLCMFIAVFLYQGSVVDVLGPYSASLLFSSIVIGALTYALALMVLRPAPVVSLFREFIEDFRPVARRVVRW